MDKLDYKILEILDWNARLPLSKIAKLVKSNKDVVAYRIKKLEENKIILNYFPIFNMYKLGFSTSRLYFDLEEMSPEKEKEFVEFLDKKINAGLIFRMDYPYKYGIFLWTKTVEEVQDTLIEIKRYLGSLLVKYNYTIICTFRQYPKDYLFDKETHLEFIGMDPTEKVSYDKDDFIILNELAKNAKATSVEISNSIGLPQTTVYSKIKKFEEKGIIQGYRAEINHDKLGYTNYFLEIYLTENQNLKQIESWANACKNVVWFQKIVGTCDIEIEVEVEGRAELEDLLKSLREKFNEIRKIVFWSQEYKKLTYLPKKI